ncbi:Cof-type HAD-IIB family hydrolase [Lactococcus piscium]|uniref:Cof-type HAD-IIB family hydrolase n=1 Tax=Pseudolactococcus carnosus TaxID=2749961 RepID=UPI0015DCD686|nr:Cof-type HAD-IIB family hydrolase [Lactococcus carnosus]MCJ1974671.1 Cof-type HAD-IIB family hydrolase [Lactococcus carnosus]MCJ1980747.1 Cof-type HAD-IIB family hydrolase [Lactococcus carnosus]MCJ1984979.1 Cof-type HAD-IIB family hydrolase [Lactococcus carnosus]MCJ1987920.1 Cof-type HAD-IIB family hydrolase [Lactococcus carnosus]MCJ2004434.1 Cof-type HAD-IIB family hydrolase [Lactococcus carnosus]
MENINKHYHALAFFDLDGTLLNKDSQLDESVSQALHTIRDNGILPIIATGRGHFELEELMAQSGITSAITMNGQYIIVEGETIYHHKIPLDKLLELKILAEDKNQPMAFYDKSGNWVSGVNQLVKDAYTHIDSPLPTVDNNRHLTDEVNMLLLFTNQAKDVAYYRNLVPAFDYFKNTPFSIDVVNAGSNKGTGVQKVVELLGFTGETYGFGDGPNDLHLLEAVDHATAMGNGIDELKAIADFVSTANTDNGIINAFKHWHLL